MVALTASQAPGINLTQPGEDRTDPSAGSQHPADGDSPYHTELPPLLTPDGPEGPGGSDGPVVTGPAESGIPATVLAAYKKAERTLRAEQPGCNLPWQLLAAIGKVESGQARGGALDAAGNTLKPIRGPVLDGNGFALIKDTDGGRYDGDSTHDRAVGPMQFIPSTWATWGADGNGDGRKDPNNIHDAALAAARYLCAGNRDLSRPADLERAVLSYNRSREYLNTVLSWLEFYRKGTHEVPDGSGVLPDTPGAGNSTKPAQPSTGTSAGSTPPGSTAPKKPSGKAPSDRATAAKPAPGTVGTPTSRPKPTASATKSPLPSFRPTHPPTRPAPTASPTKPTKPTGRPTRPAPTTKPTDPTDPPAECPTETASPTPSDSVTGSPSPTPTPTRTPAPTPTATGPSPSPTTTDDPEEPVDPCAEEENADTENTADGEGKDGGPEQADGARPSATPSVSRSLAALAARILG
ncbi:lytic murein transglycosylase [Streptomyces sp. 549]|uniref:lytic transglycosylase domain-containing protein n=1 Tax=Streptomyces sp. 549 TaxID=3049076 RepID=UPI0024C46FDF|nr:lytic transglycosylase domain-containing protein [Streptomyces sp. 549]MDK1474155.1 lytic murein transglycosylase [Streptomyces sp. 549]